jgi:DNA-binding winged helix-turn-helix (wHTH) protein
MRFGRFTLDRARRQLWHREVGVHPTPKAFHLLVLLTSGAPRVPTNSRIHERLWASTCVSDARLARLVKERRRAVGDRDLSTETATRSTVRPIETP